MNTINFVLTAIVSGVPADFIVANLIVAHKGVKQVGYIGPKLVGTDFDDKTALRTINADGGVIVWR